jgi:hypothetical protein
MITLISSFEKGSSNDCRFNGYVKRKYEKPSGQYLGLIMMSH